MEPSTVSTLDQSGSTRSDPDRRVTPDRDGSTGLGHRADGDRAGPSATRTSTGQPTTAGTAPAGPTGGDPSAPDRFVPLARAVGERCAPFAGQHDRDATFVVEAYAAMAELGYLRLAVPTELGGLGASMRQVCHAEAELARHCAASALAAAMHVYNTLALSARRRAGAADAEAALRRVAEDGLIITTSGGSDWLWPTTVAVEVDGGYRVRGRKSFCSQAPVGGVISTSAVVGEPGPGAEVIHFTMPLRAEGVRIVDVWDTLGMRGTASQDVVIDDVVVPAERVVDRRPWGHFGPALYSAACHFAPVVASVYWGIGRGAADHAVERLVSGTRGGVAAADSAERQRQVGLMESRLRVAWWALEGALADVGEAMKPGPGTLTTLMLAKRECVLAGREVVDLAMESLGGSSYFRSSPLERALRDARAGAFHPLTPEATLTYAGRLRLGGDVTVT
jgi:acyl-CoA dehydrogenase